MDTKITKLNNNIEFAYKRNPDTPRVAFYLNFSLNKPSLMPGVYSLMVRLFMQGTKSRTAQQLSEELDKYAIDFSAELKLDYIKFKFVCLNEDFEKALEIFTDIVKNTTFDEFEKERTKLQGEIVAELDSPRAKIIDSYYKNWYRSFANSIKDLSKIAFPYFKEIFHSQGIVFMEEDLNIDLLYENYQTLCSFKHLSPFIVGETFQVQGKLQEEHKINHKEVALTSIYTALISVILVLNRHGEQISIEGCLFNRV